MSVLATSIVKDQTQLAVLWQADAWTKHCVWGKHPWPMASWHYFGNQTGVHQARSCTVACRKNPKTPSLLHFPIKKNISEDVCLKKKYYLRVISSSHRSVRLGT
jgi:hypothetical protein